MAGGASSAVASVAAMDDGPRDGGHHQAGYDDAEVQPSVRRSLHGSGLPRAEASVPSRAYAGAMTDGASDIGPDIGPDLGPDLVDIRERREDVRTALDEVERALATAAAGKGEEWGNALAERLAALHTEFEEHVFATESPEGLFEDVITEAPRL